MLIQQQRLRVIVLALFFAPAIGCANTTSFWNQPGTIQQQRNRASLYDPFPDNQMGPASSDLRPRDFKHQLPEPEKAQLYSEIRDGFQ